MIDVNYYASKRLKQLRIENGITQQQLADDLKISQQQIARLESNQRKFKQDMLFKLSNYFDVSIDSFTPYDENMDEIEKLYHDNKLILTDDDKSMIKYIIEKRKNSQ